MRRRSARCLKKALDETSDTVATTSNRYDHPARAINAILICLASVPFVVAIYIKLVVSPRQLAEAASLEPAQA